MSYCNVSYQEFEGNEEILFLDDGRVVTQGILKYICANFKGKFGENLYPEDLRPKIDEICTPFSFKIQTDEEFTKFILREFPEWLKNLDEILAHKYVLSEKLTMADIHIASFLLNYPYNENYQNCHIL